MHTSEQALQTYADGEGGPRGRTLPSTSPGARRVPAGSRHCGPRTQISPPR